MTQQHGSRWSLASTGNRVLLAVVIGLLLSFFCGTAGITGAARLIIFLITAGVAYVLVTVLHRARS